jgi:hypothetical protein
VTETGISAEYSYYAEDPVGSPLRVAHAYGIDVVSIEVASPLPLVVTFDGDADTTFHIAAVGWAEDVPSVLAVDPAGRVTLDDPYVFDRLSLIITRGEAGAGTYTVRLDPP